MTEVTLLEPDTRSIEAVRRENCALAEALVKERALRVEQAPRARLQGWHIVVMVLGCCFMVMSFLWSTIQMSTASAERSADRSHEQAMAAIEKLGNVAETTAYVSGFDLLIYMVCGVAGLFIMWWVTHKAGVV